MIIGTSEMTKYIDKVCIEELEIPLIVLMENAILAAIKHMDTELYDKYTVVCGVGNNGGDGLGLARHLSTIDKNIDVFVVGDINRLTKCSKINYNILLNMGITVNLIKDNKDIEKLHKSILENQVVIDAIFGTGLKRNIDGLFENVVKTINYSSSNIYSIDVPSGIDSTTGRILGNCIKANKTICFEFYKRGFLNYSTSKFLGEVYVEKIGVPKNIIKRYGNEEYITDEKFIREKLIKRDKHAFKGNFGRVSIFAGSIGFYGASYIATEAAVKSGSGLVTLVSSKDVQNKISTRLTEAMTLNYDDYRYENLVKSSDAIGFGCGMGDSEDTLDILSKVIEISKCSIVLDADGLNVIRDRCEKILNKENKFIITPHLGEMSRLTGKSIEYIRDNRIDVSKEFANRYNVVVVLKGYETVITDGKTTYVNPTGNSAMATGGMGDCLVGIITSLIGQGMSNLDASVVGVYIHGYIGDRLSQNRYTVTASDVIDNIPIIMNDFIK